MELAQVTPGSYGAYDDGIVMGRLLRAGRTCDVCFRHTSCIEVARYDNMLKEWRSTVIWIHRGDQELAVYLGVGCGCLAKFHRQVAHIRSTHRPGWGAAQ